MDVRETVGRVYGIRVESAELIRHNENAMYCLTANDGKQYGFRIKQPVDGYSMDVLGRTGSMREEMLREVGILRALSANGLKVQTVVPAKNGEDTTDTGEGIAMLYEWQAGQSLDRCEITPEMGAKIGRMAAKMHSVLKKCDGELPEGGVMYDEGMMLRIENRICRANGFFGAYEVDMCAAAKEIARRMRDMGEIQTAHCDFSPGNILDCDGEPVPIDFSLNGKCHVQMDIAGLFAQISDEDIRNAILQSYNQASGRQITKESLEPYFAMQVLLFITCQWQRYQKEAWFTKALGRWAKDIFRPVTKQISFL